MSKRSRSRRATIAPWWNVEGDPHVELFAAVDHFVDSQRSERNDICLHMALYGDEGAIRAYESRYRWSRADRDATVRFNLIKSVCDTMQAEVASVTPRPSFLTQRGRWDLRKRAQKLELMVEGEYDRNDVYEQAAQGFLDAAKTGITGLKVTSENGLVCIERVLPGELVVDPVEAQTGTTRTLYHTFPCDVETLRALYADDQDKLKALESVEEMSPELFPWLPRDTLVYQVQVVEAWRLPDGTLDDEGKLNPGRRVLSVRGVTLEDEPWTRTRFPVALWKYEPQSMGFVGRSAVGNLRSIQLELNDLLAKKQDAIGMSAWIRWLVEGNSQVSAEQLGNTPHEVIRYTGIAPQQQNVSAVPAEIFREVADLIQRGYDQEGVSQMSASARKPGGLDSGAALREYQDIESRRFLIKIRSYERWLGVHLARIVVDEKIAAAERGEAEQVAVSVRRGRKSYLGKVDWKDCVLEEGTYGIRVFPASSLPSSPAGRMATVEQWVAAGWLTREQGMALLDFPDIDDFTSLELAPYEIVLDAIEDMLEDGEYHPPEPAQDLELAKKLAQSAYLRARYDGCPEENTELLLRYMGDCDALLQMAAMAAAPAPQMAAGMSPEQMSAGAAAVPPGPMAAQGAPPMLQ